MVTNAAPPLLPALLIGLALGRAGSRTHALIENMRKKTVIKKLTALIERWPEEARERLMEAAWQIDGELLGAAIERGLRGDQSDTKPTSPA